MGNKENREEEEKTEVSEERAVDAQEWKAAYILQVNEIDTTSELGLLAGYLVDVGLDSVPELIAYSSSDSDMYTYEMVN
ncbi:unknown [Clostridium sp. CAG:632]|nr:unknown [Clostridium sp. CAG:632]